MRAANTFQALCLGALLGLTGCVTVHHDHDYGYDDEYDRPMYGPRYVHYGVEHIYDVNLGVYTVVGYPDTYWHDGWYWHHAHGYWERCGRPYGGHWDRADWEYVPQRLRPRYGDDRGERWKRADRRDQNWHARFERDEARRDRHEESADFRHDQRNERQAERHVLGDGRHDRRDERWQGQEARAEQRHDRLDERQDLKHDRRSAQQLERHEQRTGRRDERRERREEQHDRRHGFDDAHERYAREGRE